MHVHAKVGRNDSCPCGSGKKYKRCCLTSHDAVDLTWHRLRRAEGWLVDGTVRHVLDRFGRGPLDAAWAEFTLWAEPTTDPVGQPEFDSVFIPWFVFNWVADFDEADGDVPPDWPRRPLALEYLEAHPEADAFTRRFAVEAGRRSFSFWVVTGVQPGRSLMLKDLMTAVECVVLERSASTQLERGAIVFARVLELDGVAIMCGSAPLIIPPSFHGSLIDLRQALAGTRGRLDSDDVLDCELQLRETYFAIADELYNPRPPVLCNTDGDPIALVKLQFGLRCTPQDAFDRLQSLSRGDAEDALDEAKLGVDGSVQTVRFDWRKRGNKVHADWDNTVMGTLAIDGTELTAEVNSERRARAIRSKIEKRLGDRVVFLRATVQSVEDVLKEHKGRPETAAKRREREEQKRLNDLPEVQAQLRAMAERHWERWLDEKIPALNYQTPRQAAQTAEGRERLEALLAEFEWQAKRSPDMAMNPELPALRRKLGLGK